QVDLAGRRITVESRGGIDACTGIAADDDLSIPDRGTDQLSAFALVVVPTQAPVAGALGTFALLAHVSHHRVRSRCGAILALGAAATKADAAPSVHIPAVLTVFTLDVAETEGLRVDLQIPGIGMNQGSIQLGMPTHMQIQQIMCMQAGLLGNPIGFPVSSAHADRSTDARRPITDANGNAGIQFPTVHLASVRQGANREIPTNSPNDFLGLQPGTGDPGVP